MNETHDPSVRSWVASANAADQDFPLQNLPFAVFRRAAEPWRCGVAIGDQILDLAAVFAAGKFEGDAHAALAACTGPTLNNLMSLGAPAWRALRQALWMALREGGDESLRACLVAQRDAEYDVPAHIGDFTDFYTSIHHASRVGALFRPDSPLLPNYKWLPIGYHGRSSSVGVSGQFVRRPIGQTMAPGDSTPKLVPCARLDYELELGVFVGRGNPLGFPIDIDQAESHVFGVCLLNDWSARDLQAWEYQPLGPFLAKNFATTVSPWVVTLEALAPFRTSWTRAESDPQPLAYLDSAALRASGAFDIQLDVFLSSSAMREKGLSAYRLSRSNFRDAYWSISQMVTHHTVNGCNLRPGDLLGTGTQSGASLDEAGSLVELTRGGKDFIDLPGGETRGFLQDGDRVEFAASCSRVGAARIGFGRVSGTVLPALERA